MIYDALRCFRFTQKSMHHWSRSILMRAYILKKRQENVPKNRHILLSYWQGGHLPTAKGLLSLSEEASLMVKRGSFNSPKSFFLLSKEPLSIINKSLAVAQGACPVHVCAAMAFRPCNRSW